MKSKINVSIIGGSGYAGGELLRILLCHRQINVVGVTSRSFEGQSVTRAHPNLRKITDLTFCHPSKIPKCDLLFLALPNGVSMGLMSQYKNKASKIIDLGADFRLRNKETFELWYRKKHLLPNMLPQFVYGISELHRDEIRKAKFVACGGCEATVSILTLYPLIKHHIIKTDNIIIDAKMSSSQGGNSPSLASHHPERHGVVRTYKPTDHRHTAEIEQELAPYTNKINVSVTATTIEMVRGLLVTIHAGIKKGISLKDVWRAYRTEYIDEPFIRIVKETDGNYRYPEPKILIGTNFCDIGFELSHRENRLVAIGAIDNLGKGTAGQAVQAMNIMFGFEEKTGLEFPGLHPV
ncbi:N-acetyl-gamma-glutamyl-phosphate reductase [Candidatus Gottesmanbacteria bacterium RIFCSPLOWO2_01_FULL_39_12b]|uniref:N-acetyl-gamma-glutamyl-phosphate reductase n=1 Tax=Candidatus Gottesmanbacteria bacterium RIFCSPLOWO2_01_FULL_39_12b TaxID=1798388 RepID=A0A1F6ARW5_9BACT|nr:MAG: N-acetyl-gamma-glutamyl-phosphate reductase [Candidatus Gottesmanbacteria bacterium RIFCSPLOWO2_01_FULL_39_12b]